MTTTKSEYDGFEEWFDSLEIYKIEPYTVLDNKYQIKTLLMLAWEDGFADGYNLGTEGG